MKNNAKNIAKNIKNEGRNARQDGDETKTLLVECAGRLIAAQGYDKTTSKSICEAARANMAAINYHFGGRDGLYIAVLEEVHRRLMNVDRLTELEASDIPAEEKINRLIGMFIAGAFGSEGWETKVWARELISPSPFIGRILSEKAAPKLHAARRIFAEYTGLPADDPRLYCAIMSTMAPFLLLFLTDHENIDFREILKVGFDRKVLLENLKSFAAAGLASLKKENA